MKKIIKVWIGLTLLGLAAGMANAGEFALMQPAHPIVATGIFSDFKSHSDAGAAVALVTSKTISEWTPVDLGGSLGRALGGPSLSVGSTVNLLPEIKQGLFSAVSALYPDPDMFTNIKEIFSPPNGGTPDVNMIMGPHFSYVFYKGLKGRGCITIFSAAKWSF